MNDEFYIGWESKAPPGIGRFLRATVVGLLIAAIGLALMLGAAQHTIGASVFEWGTVKNFSGVLKLQPYPHLLVARPGTNAFHTLQSMEVRTAGFSTYYLVAPFKFGLDR